MSVDLKAQIKFGTDGWRGVISDNFTFANVKIVAQSIAQWVNHTNITGQLNEVKRVAIGYDARFLSDEYAEAVACL